MARKNLTIPWDTTIPRGTDQFADSARTLTGPKASTAEGPDASRLVDSSRTLTGNLGKAPAAPGKTIPRDRLVDLKRTWPA